MIPGSVLRCDVCGSTDGDIYVSVEESVSLRCSLCVGGRLYGSVFAAASRFGRRAASRLAGGARRVSL